MNLYIVGTPIGNLEDASFRQIDTLKNVDVILAEDTRMTIKLLNHFDITTPLKSYHDFNKETITKDIIEEMKRGTVFALVSDAGMPVISDPGYELVRSVQDEGLKYTVIPAASAFQQAVVLSGIESFEFTYFGFLPKSNKKRKEKLEEILMHEKTSVLYESPYRVKQLIDDIYKFDEKRVVSISREITKKFEQTVTDTSKNIREKLASDIPLKGEFVIVIERHVDNSVEEFDMDINTHVDMLIETGLKPKAAIKKVAKLRQLKTQDVYDTYHRI